jgi:hypothetical protein
MREGPLSPMATTNDDDDALVVTAAVVTRSIQHTTCTTDTVIPQSPPVGLQLGLSMCAAHASRLLGASGSRCGHMWKIGRLPLQRVGGLMHGSLHATCILRKRCRLERCAHKLESGQLVHPSISNAHVRNVCVAHTSTGHLSTQIKPRALRGFPGGFEVRPRARDEELNRISPLCSHLRLPRLHLC